VLPAVVKKPLAAVENAARHRFAKPKLERGPPDDAAATPAALPARTTELAIAARRAARASLDRRPARDVA
jgi:hypothetical protein